MSTKPSAPQSNEQVVEAMKLATLNAWVVESAEVVTEAVGFGHPELLPTQPAKCIYNIYNQGRLLMRLP
jgi:hypothetical protein